MSNTAGACRHKHCGAFGGGWVLWCYDCGALRQMQHERGYWSGKPKWVPRWKRWLAPRGTDAVLRQLNKMPLVVIPRGSPESSEE